LWFELLALEEGGYGGKGDIMGGFPLVTVEAGVWLTAVVELNELGSGNNGGFGCGKGRWEGFIWVLEIPLFCAGKGVFKKGAGCVPFFLMRAFFFFLFSI
jgi:hypothetical protein